MANSQNSSSPSNLRTTLPTLPLLHNLPSDGNYAESTLPITPLRRFVNIVTALAPSALQSVFIEAQKTTTNRTDPSFLTNDGLGSATAQGASPFQEWESTISAKLDAVYDPYRSDPGCRVTPFLPLFQQGPKSSGLHAGPLTLAKWAVAAGFNWPVDAYLIG